MAKAKIILIAGPTASGKSALALERAGQVGGTVINADAMQIYAGLPILTAQPDAEAQKNIPHRLYGVVDPAQSSSAGKWRVMALDAIREAREAGHVPILVGGTGLYFRSLLGGLADIPSIPDEAREKAQALYERLGGEEFRRSLAQLDPASAERLAKNDRQRLIRAYEVVTHTGKPLGEWHHGNAQNALEDFEIEAHLLMPPREELYATCDKRFAQMMEQGAVEEVGRLLERRLDPSLPAMKILGVREIAAYLNGEFKKDEAIAQGQQATRNYAKRQLTWFRNQWPFG